jgi:ubiquinone/menaquinone biosynthesis C-methylase UbiE
MPKNPNRMKSRKMIKNIISKTIEKYVIATDVMLLDKKKRAARQAIRMETAALK